MCWHPLPLRKNGTVITQLGRMFLISALPNAPGWVAMMTGVRGSKNSYIQDTEVEYDERIAKEICEFLRNVRSYLGPAKVQIEWHNLQGQGSPRVEK